LAWLIVASLALVGCGGGVVTVGGQPGGTGMLVGAGASLPAPLYQRWAADYRQRTGGQVNYQAIGSGGGVQQLIARTVDFGASDAPMTDDELARARSQVLHIPTVLGAVVVAYNLPGRPAGLRLRPAVVAGIFLGRITRWNDPAITADNPGVALPAMVISVVHRADGSGTTSIFTTWLSSTNPEWHGRVGAGKEVEWPTGIGAKGNEGVTAFVRQIPGAIGYVELAYARHNGLPVAAIGNRAGRFVLPEPQAVTAAAAGATIPDDLRFWLVDAPGAQAYPIAGATWLLVYTQQGDRAKGKALAEFLWWAVHDGQALAPPLLYAALPPSLIAGAERKIRSITWPGKPAGMS